MRKQILLLFLFFSVIGFLLSSCSNNNSASTASNDSASVKYGGFPDQISYGQHLVTIIGCNDCHTPKKMTPMGPVPDSSLLLSGHPASMPAPDVNRKEMEGKGLAVTGDLTAWVGPWGISYSANLTPDATGIGNWSEQQFIKALREGKFKGMDGTRPLLPPMPWQDFSQMKDEEIKAIFAYLKTIKPVNNVVPAAVTPVTAMHH
jgi:mono/diheme cytochrome c family protein